jgi:hypothetical protein
VRTWDNGYHGMLLGILNVVRWWILGVGMQAFLFHFASFSFAFARKSYHGYPKGPGRYGVVLSVLFRRCYFLLLVSTVTRQIFVCTKLGFQCIFVRAT